MKRREFMKRALAPLAAVLGLKPEGLPAMSTDTAPLVVYFPDPPHWQYLPPVSPDSVLTLDGAGCMTWRGWDCPAEKEAVE